MQEVSLPSTSVDRLLDRVGIIPPFNPRQAYLPHIPIVNIDVATKSRLKLPRTKRDWANLDLFIEEKLALNKNEIDDECAFNEGY